MFRASSCPLSGAYILSTAVAASGLPLESGGSSVVGRGRPRPAALLSPRSNGKPEAATAVDKLLMMGMKAPENMLNCI